MISVAEPSFPVHIGRCVYCGASNGLSDEHIVPYGLHGTWILRAASCDVCARITKSLEGYVQRVHLGALRAKLGFRTRHKRERPTSWPLKLITDGEEVDRQVTTHDNPAVVLFPRFPRPAHRTGERVGSGIKALRWGEAHHLPSVRRLHASGATHLTLPVPDENRFARLLAKIAHCYAVGCIWPRPLASGYVVPAVLGIADDIGQWVGEPDGDAIIPATEMGGAAATVPQGPGEVTVRVRVLGRLGFPEYEVIVGRVT